MKFSQKNFENWRFWKTAILKNRSFWIFFCKKKKKKFFAWSPWKSVTNYVVNGWISILMFSLFSSKFLAMRNYIYRYTVYVDFRYNSNKTSSLDLALPNQCRVRDTRVDEIKLTINSNFPASYLPTQTSFTSYGPAIHCTYYVCPKIFLGVLGRI